MRGVLRAYNDTLQREAYNARRRTLAYFDRALDAVKEWTVLPTYQPAHSIFREALDWGLARQEKWPASSTSIHWQ